jgi:hypothetical protein
MAMSDDEIRRSAEQAADPFVALLALAETFRLSGDINKSADRVASLIREFAATFPIVGHQLSAAEEGVYRQAMADQMHHTLEAARSVAGGQPLGRESFHRLSRDRAV